MLLVKKCNDFHYLFSFKIGLEIRFNNIIIEKKPFLTIKTKIFQRLKNGICPKGLTHAFGQKMQFFFIIYFR